MANNTRIFFEILLLIIALVILVYLSFHYAQIRFSPVPKINPADTICIKENCFNVELAKTEVQRERGLMYRKELDKDKGMLFIFDKEDIYPFWMKNTLIPLDIIWINGLGKVVFIGQNIMPCKSIMCSVTTPTAKASYVLEVNAGVSTEIGLKIGDQLKININ